ncbi:MAG TPA: tripartite tricarboxylate transporter substrate-binding protein [Noviherbaspirillum sp.]|jgi:tripartite-type tricarboxylate transporter receptor subunit TctC|uniref:Bug family tripartite tricarboxylate transporter substrate binding protein n=1 Tax=Noviherbaspirillum sp. TaxID=1926288 RepID=UPI002DDD0DF9|nr:tripartite tricarboxylate transporter substrate-binding protein [Noviherbaspirillum sp.]HEV2608879.1 tripartite tricarboxylate transporter substrate-binding protein [Noviherbaspirillum sp.]
MKMPSVHRRALLKAALSLTIAVPAFAPAQDKPVEWVIGYAAGGGSDVVARTVAAQMSQSLGRSIVVNNKPGAATNIAAGYVAQSKDLGNVMLTADFATLAANPALFSKLPYDPEKDFKPIGLLARFPLFLVVGPNVPAKNFKEFQEWVQSNPANAHYASAGIGSPHHLAAELLRERTGLKIQHVAYRGAAPAVQDLLGGQVPFGLMDSASVQQYLSNGKLRAIGVASARRLTAFPDIPTLAEQGVEGYEAYAWQGLVVPAATPAPVAANLAKALQAALASAPVRERFQSLSLEALPGTPEQMAAYARSERERWGKVIRANNVRMD